MTRIEPSLHHEKRTDLAPDFVCSIDAIEPAAPHRTLTNSPCHATVVASESRNASRLLVQVLDTASEENMINMAAGAPMPLVSILFSSLRI